MCTPHEPFGFPSSTPSAAAGHSGDGGALASDDPDLLEDLERILVEIENEEAKIERQRAMAFESVREEISRYKGVMRGVLLALVAAVDAKDAYTHGHSHRVGAYSRRIGVELGLMVRELQVLTFGAVLHDVGKIGMPECILNKAGRLTDEERAVVMEHPLRGSEIIGKIPQMGDVERIVRHHHERFDGDGYPDRLKGRDIPRDARIVSVSDTFDAITTTRSYRVGRSNEYAMNILRDEAGRQLDAEIVAVFERLLATGALDGFRGDEFDADELLR